MGTIGAPERRAMATTPSWPRRSRPSWLLVPSGMTFSIFPLARASSASRIEAMSFEPRSTGNAFPGRGKEAEEGIAPGLGFREAGDVAGVEIRVQQRGLEEVHVVRDEDKRALPRDLRELGAVQLA